MKQTLFSLILGILFFGCTDKELPSKYLTNITVIRETEQGVPNKTTTVYTSSETNTVPQTPVRIGSQAKYHIIVSSFGPSEKARAEELVAKLKAKDYPASLIFSSQRYRVSIESFSTETEANTARDEYRTITDRQDIWVHKTE